MELLGITPNTQWGCNKWQVVFSLVVTTIPERPKARRDLWDHLTLSFDHVDEEAKTQGSETDPGVWVSFSLFHRSFHPTWHTYTLSLFSGRTVMRVTWSFMSQCPPFPFWWLQSPRWFLLGVDFVPSGQPLLGKVTAEKKARATSHEQGCPLPAHPRGASPLLSEPAAHASTCGFGAALRSEKDLLFLFMEIDLQRGRTQYISN